MRPIPLQLFHTSETTVHLGFSAPDAYIQVGTGEIQAGILLSGEIVAPFTELENFDKTMGKFTCFDDVTLTPAL